LPLSLLAFEWSPQASGVTRTNTADNMRTKENQDLDSDPRDRRACCMREVS
jgi:hypothetical protein